MRRPLTKEFTGSEPGDADPGCDIVALLCIALYLPAPSNGLRPSAGFRPPGIVALLRIALCLAESPPFLLRHWRETAPIWQTFGLLSLSTRFARRYAQPPPFLFRHWRKTAPVPWTPAQGFCPYGSLLCLRAGEGFSFAMSQKGYYSISIKHG